MNYWRTPHIYNMYVYIIINYKKYKSRLLYSLNLFELRELGRGFLKKGRV